ncbi:hypothetical protein SRHO_G00219560 [Serrasalmus rhombeus]
MTDVLSFQLSVWARTGPELGQKKTQDVGQINYADWYIQMSTLLVLAYQERHPSAASGSQLIRTYIWSQVDEDKIKALEERIAASASERTAPSIHEKMAPHVVKEKKLEHEEETWFRMEKRVDLCDELCSAAPVSPVLRRTHSVSVQ